MNDKAFRLFLKLRDMLELCEITVDGDEITLKVDEDLVEYYFDFRKDPKIVADEIDDLFKEIIKWKA